MPVFALHELAHACHDRVVGNNHAGIWLASVEGDPGCASAAFGGSKAYDWTTWKEDMNYPGATQLGIGKKLLEQYPWSRFEPHPEWAPGCIAACMQATAPRSICGRSSFGISLNTCLRDRVE